MRVALLLIIVLFCQKFSIEALAQEKEANELIKEGKKNQIRAFEKNAKVKSNFRVIDYTNIAGSSYINLEAGTTLLEGQNINSYALSVGKINFSKGVWYVGVRYINNQLADKINTWYLAEGGYDVHIITILKVIDFRFDVGINMGAVYKDEYVLGSTGTYYSLGGKAGLGMDFKINTWLSLMVKGSYYGFYDTYTIDATPLVSGGIKIYFQ